MSITNREQFLHLADVSFGDQFREPFFAPYVVTSERYINKALEGLKLIHNQEADGQEISSEKQMLKLNYQAALLGYLERKASAWYQERIGDRGRKTYLDYIEGKSKVESVEKEIIAYVKQCQNGTDNNIFINVVKGILRTADAALGLDEDSTREMRIEALCSSEETKENVARMKMP